MQKIIAISLIRIALFGSPLLMLSCNEGKGEGNKNVETSEPESHLISLTAEQMKANDFHTGSLTEKEFHQSIKANGMLDVPPENRMAISAYFGGYIKELKLLPGQKVQKGQDLLQLENPEFIQIQLEFLEAKGELRYLESDYKRQGELYKTNVASEKKFLKSEADYKVMKARYEALSKKLLLMGILPDQLEDESITSTLSLKAPMSGYITEISAEKGMYLSPSDIAMSLVNTNHLHLELNIFEKDAWKVKVGQEVVFYLQDNPSQSYLGKVHLVGKSVSEADRIVRVHVHIEEEEKMANLVPGMYAEASVRTEAVPGMALPETAVVKIGDDYKVLLQTNTADGKRSFAPKMVKAGNREEGMVQIVNAGDFAKGSVFLTKGAFNLITE